jgi:AGZA family xanthine/uracil permease-like MFS transporter
MGIISKNLGHPVDIVQYHGIVSAIPSIEPTLFKLSFSSLFAKSIISVITVVIIFLFLDIFDTMGTLIGLGEQANLLKDGTLPKAQETFLSDAAGTVAGAALGTSTVTSYIESAAGISAGGKTGLTSVFVSIFFLLALFFNPLVKMVGIAYTVNNVQFYPVIAPVLIVVGFLMMQNVTKIQWDNLVESIPSFLCLMIMPLTFSITEGIAFAFISYSLLTLVVGKFLQVHWLVHVFSLLFILRFIFLM